MWDACYEHDDSSHDKKKHVANMTISQLTGHGGESCQRRRERASPARERERGQSCSKRTTPRRRAHHHRDHEKCSSSSCSVSAKAPYVLPPLHAVENPIFQISHLMIWHSSLTLFSPRPRQLTPPVPQWLTTWRTPGLGESRVGTASLLSLAAASPS